MAKPIKLAAGLAAWRCSRPPAPAAPAAAAARGGGGKTLVISTDLPMQGASADASEATINAIKLYLDQVGYKAGTYTIKLQDVRRLDRGGRQVGRRDVRRERDRPRGQRRRGRRHGHLQLGLREDRGARSLEQAPTARMLMVSHANTNPGLTKAWDPGEPDKYYPSGTRNYARVITTDDYQGSAAAQFAAQDLKVKKCYVLNDNETYGQGVAKAFADEATKQGINILGNEAWDAQAAQLHRAVHQDQGEEPRLRLRRRHLRQQRWPAGQGQGRGPRRQHRGQADRPGRLHRLPGPRQARRRARACT